jgi:hypothetical protein
VQRYIKVVTAQLLLVYNEEFVDEMICELV